MTQGFLDHLAKDLEAPIEARGFGTGWFSGFFALVLAIAGLSFVVALRWPDFASMPELRAVLQSGGFRVTVHAILLAAYALALLSLLLRPRKAIGATALVIALAATFLGGSAVQAEESNGWGIFFGIDFFAVNMVAAGLMFAPLERFFPRHADQRLFRPEWREDLFYYLVSSLLVQLITFINLAPSSYINANWDWLAGTRAAISGLPWLVQFVLVLLLTDLAQYWFHRTFHRVPFLWGFHAVHHSARSMDWLASARMHFVEMILMRSITSLPLLTLGFLPSVMQVYIGLVYVWSSLLHANLGGDFDRIGKWIAVPRFHHWHHAIDPEGVDKNFAIHFAFLDRLFGTFYLPEGKWPSGYGVPERVPSGYLAQFRYPFVRKVPD
jgi:sterol desaturase/sphingolipid hydroxylase (fatty acid hydroxylase superfamily)